jgi:hypothetical protein
VSELKRKTATLSCGFTADALSEFLLGADAHQGEEGAGLQSRGHSMPPTLRNSMPAINTTKLPESLMLGNNDAGPPKEFVKSIHGHYCVPAPKSQWLKLLTFLFDETLLHPHALVYCDESVASRQGFEQLMDRHNLIVKDYGSGSPKAAQDENVKRNLKQFLVTNPKFSSMVSKPSISCIFHMGGVNSPLAYGARLGPVDEELGWDAISVLFIEAHEVGIKTEIEKTYGIEFKEIPFDLPEISMHADKKEWSSAAVGGNWWQKTKTCVTVNSAVNMMRRRSMGGGETGANMARRRSWG